ncbi:disulfide bond formation protein B [Sinorhizobium sp. BG8]|uniref:disulfide bond formation protein B n=1 Tax=Sinorhizobium sp. BG8 TaxID=2613773 RepID=UPI00193EBA54|nr:disulfide bond formation protein B [Sinorhizobium sp. BG8]QRM53398.1 disulfide bond formation protein B [Sinorhizobium sp. BG8]
MNSSVTPKNRLLPSLLLALGMAGTVGGALGFQHIGGYIPCALCLLQRDPYYYGIPVAVLAAASAFFGGPAWLTRSLLVIVGVMMLVGAGLGVYHSGVEWHFWEGPATCSTSAPGIARDAGSLLSELSTTKPPSCSDASFRFLGLSFAGWNVIASLILAAIAFGGARGKRA